MPTLSVSNRLSLQNSVDKIKSNCLEKSMTEAENACFNGAIKLLNSLTPNVMLKDYDLNTYGKLQKSLLMYNTELKKIINRLNNKVVR